MYSALVSETLLMQITNSVSALFSLRWFFSRINLKKKIVSSIDWAIEDNRIYKIYAMES